jgi:hypothetical protein
MSKIFNAAESVVGSSSHPSQAAAPAAAVPPASTTTPGSPATPAATAASAGSAPPQTVDVEAVLLGLASQKGGGGNWRTSIVDLPKLLDLDSRLNARKELATELDVHAGVDGSAEENIALHKAVMHKLAENGGKVPYSMKG